MRRPFAWTARQFDRLSKVRQVLDDLTSYKPLTLRQIFYQLVAQGHIENTRSQYGMLSRLIKYARIRGYIPWHDIEDRIRVHRDLTGWTNKTEFVDEEVERFLDGYCRNLLQSQDRYLEIWIEKDALSTLFTRIAVQFTVPVVVCRGFSSVSFLNEFADRVEGHPDKQPVMLYFGDFDPSGNEMLETMQMTLQDEMGIYNISFKRVALTRQDIVEHNLPHNPDAIKTTDTRAKKHLRRYGNLAVELDALRPDLLQDKIRRAIESELDMDAFKQELVRRNEELVLLKELKEHVEELIREEI